MTSPPSTAVDPTHEVPPAPQVHLRSERLPSATRRLVVCALVLGLATAAGVYAMISSGVVPEPVAFALLIGVVAVVPTAETLHLRVAVNISLLVGFAPLLWWVQMPAGVTRGGLVVSLAAGVILAVSVLSRSRAWRVSLRPIVGRADLLLPAGAAAALAATKPLAFAGSPIEALEVLLPGADNYAHFNMFSNLRAYGATTDVIGPGPDTSGWAFDNYPKGFHALVATVSEVGFPGMRTGPESVVVYAHSVAVVIILGILMVTAAMLSLPKVSARPAIALPCAVLTWTALLWEPGQKVLANGFAGFWLGAVSAACALLLGVAAFRGRAYLRVLSVGGLLICVCHTWTPLVIIAAPAAFAALVDDPDRAKMSRPGRNELYLRLALLAVCCLAASRAVVILLRTVDVGFIVSEVSGFNGTSPLPTFVLLAVLLYFLLFRAKVLKSSSSAGDDTMRRRLRLLAMSPLLGTAALSVLLTLQMRTIGTTSYYFLKYLLGFELILAVVAPAVVAAILAQGPPRVTSRRFAVVACSATALLATQFFGHLTPSQALLFSIDDDGTAAIVPPYTRGGIARGIMAAVASSTPSKSFDREYVPTGRGNAIQVFYPGGWYHAINASLSNDVMARLATLRVNADTAEDVAPLVEGLLQSDDDVRIIIDASAVPDVRERIHPTALAARLVPIDVGSPR